MADKKKKNFSGIIFLVTYALFGGMLVKFLDVRTVADVVVIVVSLVICFLLMIIVHELGHLICGWASGYTFGFFKLGSLSWFTEDNEIKFKRSKNFAVGQCAMTPPETEAEFKFLLYNLGGALFNFLTGLVMILLWYILPSGHLLRNFAMIGIGINLLFGIINLIPMPSTGNDGANIVEASKSTDGKRAFYLIMYINGQLMKGKRIKELNEETIRVYGKLNSENYLVGNVLLFEMDYLLETGQAKEALAIAQQVNTDKFPILHRRLFSFIQLFIYINHLPDFEKARAIYEDEEFQNLLKMKLPNVSIVLPAYEFFVNNNYEKAEKLLVQVKEDVANVPNKGERLGMMDYLEQLEEKLKIYEKDREQ